MKLPVAPLAILLLFTALGWGEPPAVAPHDAPAPLGAPAPAEPPPAKISVDLQCLTLPQTIALPIIGKLRSTKPAERAAAMAEISGLLEKGTAKLVGWPIVIAPSGQKGVSEAVEEIRYPAEFDAGSASVYLTDNDGTATKQPTRLRGTDTQPVASTFDTRNVGVSFVVEPTLSIFDKSVELAFKASHVLLKSIDRWTIEHELTTEKKTEKVIQEQPRFTSYRAENIVTVESGGHKLVGIFKTGDPEPTLELFIIGAEFESK